MASFPNSTAFSVFLPTICVCMCTCFIGVGFMAYHYRNLSIIFSWELRVSGVGEAKSKAIGGTGPWYVEAGFRSQVKDMLLVIVLECYCPLSSPHFSHMDCSTQRSEKEQGTWPCLYSSVSSSEPLPNFT